ncbi:MAG: prolyl oligopeptidase family serine peptidase [Thermoguttaceae bacterium]|jgi:hypothetical protein
MNVLVFATALVPAADADLAATAQGTRGKQVAGVQARHRAGQTFVTWQEVESPLKGASPSADEVRGARKSLAGKLAYRIYRSDQPIRSIKGLEPVGTAEPLSVWDDEFYGHYGSKAPCPRFAIEDGKRPLLAGTGLCVHNPGACGTAYYAVTVVRNGKEDTSLGEGNVTKEALAETVGQGEPVLQRIDRDVEFQYQKGTTLYFYVRWEAPPNFSVENMPIDYLVAVPPKVRKPAPVQLSLHCAGGSILGGYYKWYNKAGNFPHTGSILISANQIPYDWWAGFHEFRYTDKPLTTKEDWLKGVVHPYSQRRVLAFYDWAATKWDIDRTRTFLVGMSMGGGGSSMMALHHGDRFAWLVSHVGIHVPRQAGAYNVAYVHNYGPEEYGTLFEDGTKAWDHFDNDWFLRNNMTREVPFICYANGKNDGMIGWKQAVVYWKALQDTRRGHVFTWGMNGHSQSSAPPGGDIECPIDIRTDQTMPAFTHCSLDNNPGTGARKPAEQLAREKAEIEAWNKANPKNKKNLDDFDGDSAGQVNAHLSWEPRDIVDGPGRWEMTVCLTAKAPKDSCTVDVTPRRCQKFAPKPDEKFRWTNTALADGKVVGCGTLAADQYGLVTIPKAVVCRGKNRLSIDNYQE